MQLTAGQSKLFWSSRFAWTVRRDGAMQKLETRVNLVRSSDACHVQSALYHHAWTNLRLVLGMESLVLAIVQRVGFSVPGNHRDDLGEKRR